MTSIYKLPQGKITITHSDKNLSIGLLELLPNKELPKHNRPVDEELVQIVGTSVIILFENGKQTKSISINEGERLVVAKNQHHIHSNPKGRRSITQWKFEGDITLLRNTRRGLRFKKAQGFSLGTNSEKMRVTRRSLGEVGCCFGGLRPTKQLGAPDFSPVGSTEIIKNIEKNFEKLL